MLDLKLGSIFDQKADMVVIPCDSQGGVTHWVHDELRHHGLQIPGEGIPYGKVQVEPTNLAYENAEFIAFAASVHGYVSSSDLNAIERIADYIKNYALQEGLGLVNMPLLGTGAGGLAPLEVYGAFEKIFCTEDAEVLNVVVFTPSRKVYQNLAAFHPSKSPKKIRTIRSPRVFISYASDDNENAEWAKRLAAKLRENGVNARFDRFHLRPGVDLPQWMTNEIVMADKVLLICDERYMAKADIRHGGVGWETMVIQGDMLTQGETKSKYIALVREETVDKGLPIYMKSKLALHWRKRREIDEEAFQDLMIALFDFDVEPELGEFPEYIVQLAFKKDGGSE